MSSSAIYNIGLLVLFVILIYAMMIRPQRKKDKEDKAMRDSLVIGDEIMTIGGVVGKVTKITEKTVIVATGEGRTKVEFVKTAIGSVTKKNTEAPKKVVKAEDEEEKKAPARDKKVTPKKLTKSEAAPAEEPAAPEADAE